MTLSGILVLGCLLSHAVLVYDEPSDSGSLFPQLDDDFVLSCVILANVFPVAVILLLQVKFIHKIGPVLNIRKFHKSKEEHAHNMRHLQYACMGEATVPLQGQVRMSPFSKTPNAIMVCD